jgi:small subunit ribosomal protein S24e
LKIKIIENKRNELLKRNEVIFSLLHEGAPTPSRIEVRKEIAKVLKTDINKVYVRKIETMTGTRTSIGEAYIYDSPEQAKVIEPKYIIIRNSPQIKREE